MKKVLFCLLFVFTASIHASSGGFSEDYVWQDRFKKAMSKAETGVAKAQYSIGEMYEKGRGTEKDINQAFDWYQRASKQNYVKAQYKLGYMYYKGMGVEKNSDKAYQLLQKPAKKGNVRAQFYLGKLYDKGQGVKKDSEKALLWYSRSSLGGYTPAEKALAEVKAHLKAMDAPKFSSVPVKAEKKKTKKASKKSAAKKSEKKPVKTAKKSKSKPVKAKTVKVSKRNALSGKIMNGSWLSRKKPAEFLPSKITKCERQSSTVVECVSNELKRNIGVANITYITKAIIYEMEKSGDFKVAYRNNILKIKKIEQVPGLSDDEEGDVVEQKITVKKGWQETEHQLECKVKDKSNINCVKNKTRKMKFKSKVVS